MIITWRRTIGVQPAIAPVEQSIAHWGFGAGPSSTVVAVRVTDDAEFLAAMCEIVTIQYNARSAVGPMGATGPPDWQAVEGFEEVACRRGREQVMATEGAARPSDMSVLRWLFPQEVPVERGNRLLLQDPDYGQREYYVTGKAIPKLYENGTPHHWQVYTQDRPL